MTTDHDARARIVLSWLREDAHENAERVLLRALDEVDMTTQRRPWWPAWRYSVSKPMRALIAVAAAGVVVAVGYQLLPTRGGPGGPGVSASPPAIPTAIPTVTPTALANRFPSAGELAVGRYQAVSAGISYSFFIDESGWRSNGDYNLTKGPLDGDAGLIFWTEPPLGAMGDPCGNRRQTAAGPTARELADAMAGVPGLEVVLAPTNASVGGHVAQHLVLHVPDALPCSPSSYYLWYAEAQGQQRYASGLDSTIYVWIVDVPGGRLVIDADTLSTAPETAADEIQAIVDSIQFNGPG
jgi:hypothetical protein